ncbi:hypothetical protein [Halobacillus trueperi]|uniref:hypothetical protein n=1 Tax=Halobacillus trueperi TaxID=156205 RepID=UPI0037369604
MRYYEIEQLEKIANEYFELLEEYFGPFYKRGIDKFTQAEIINIFETARKILLTTLDDLEKDLNQFWMNNKTKIISIIQESDALKISYCGRPSPLDGLNYIKRTALYLDILLIEDPLSYLFMSKSISKEHAYIDNLIKHAFNLLDMKKLFFGEGSMPMLAIFPFLNTQQDTKTVTEISQQSGTEYFNNLFNENFTDQEEVFSFLKTIKSSKQFTERIADSSILYTGQRDITSYLDSINSNINSSWEKSNFTVGETCGMKLYGQLTNISNRVFQSNFLRSQIAFDRYEYWNIYKWDIAKAHNKISQEEIIVNSLQENSFQWLENMDIDKFNLVRNDEQISDLRETLRKNIHFATYQDDEGKIRDKAMSNIREALEEHQKEMGDISNKLKKKFSLEGIAVVGGAIASLPTSLGVLPALGLGSTIYGTIGYCRELRNDHFSKKDTQNNIMGVLFDAREKSNGS